MLQTLQEEYFRIPFVTRIYTTACLLTTLAVHLELVTPLQLYFNPELVFKQYQVWRLVTNLLFFGYIGPQLLLNMIFTYRYCRMLEEQSFRGRTADYVLMFFFCGTLITIVALFVHLHFLSHAFTLIIIYVWSRRNPYVRMNFFGLFTFDAPYMPWVLLAFSLLLGGSIVVDAIGIAVGHVYYFLEDVFPLQENGFRILKAPNFLIYLLDPPEDDHLYTPPPEDERPGGYEWRVNQANVDPDL